MSEQMEVARFVDGLDHGAPVGFTLGDDPLAVSLPDEVFTRHSLLVGKPGMGRYTLIQHVLHHRMQRAARGETSGVIVVVDPYGELVQRVLEVVPPELLHKVRMIDLARDGARSMNVMDPAVFGHRDWCADVVLLALRATSSMWNQRLESLLRSSLQAIYEYNAHSDTEPSEMLTLAHVPALLDEGRVRGSGRAGRGGRSALMSRVLSRVSDWSIVGWFDDFAGWPQATRAEMASMVTALMSPNFSSDALRVLFGRPQSTIAFADVLRNEEILLVSTASGRVGLGPSALAGSLLVAALDRALHVQESLPFADRRRCLLVADEFQFYDGIDWEVFLAEWRPYLGHLFLSTGNLSRMGRRVSAAALQSSCALFSYQVNAEDARILSGEMLWDRVTETDLVSLDPQSCYARIILPNRSLPPFVMRVLDPIEWSGAS